MPERQIKAWLCLRVAAILDRIDGDGRPPSALEADRLGRAVDLIAAGQLHLASRTLDELRLTTRSPWNTYSLPRVGEPVRTEALRARLAAIGGSSGGPHRTT